MIQIMIAAGPHARKQALLCAEADRTQLAELDLLKPLALQYPGGRRLPVQADISGDGPVVRLWFVLDALSAGEEAVLTLVNTEPHAVRLESVHMPEEGRVVFRRGGADYTAYQYAVGFLKPHIGPIFNKYGESVTRSDFQAEEHPHHRSIWFSHGAVSLDGVSDAPTDTWNEYGNYGSMTTKCIRETVSGDVYCGFTAENVWCAQDGTKLCDDTTAVRMSCPGEDVTYLDVTLTLHACYGAVTLGATKEAGPIAVRMDETLRADRTGTLCNSWGAFGEEELWMKRAAWNDYFGKTAGGHTAGIAIFDHMQNAGYPTYWHSRNYGLFAPNRFYLGGEEHIAAGESLKFVYRIVIHEGDAVSARIAERYVDYAAPAKVTAAAV